MPRTKALAVLESGLLIPATAGIDMRTEQVVGNVVLVNYRLAADSPPSYRVYGDGKTEWGAGGATVPDTNLYRTGTDTLATDDNFRSVGGTISIVVGVEANPRVRMHKDAGATDKGGLLLGPGGGTVPDVNLYRDAADKLKTDDSLEVAGVLTTGGEPVSTRVFAMAVS